MVKILQELLDDRSPESQNRILKNAKVILKDCFKDDTYLSQLAEKLRMKKL